MLEFKAVPVETPAGCNLILGQSHFIKTVEDLYEVVVGAVPKARFGLAFCESSGPCLIRVAGNDEALRGAATRNAQAIGAGHLFVLLLGDAFPINVLNAVKLCQEVCTVYCASANPVQVIVAETDQGRGVLGVVDGLAPKGVEDEAGVAWRRGFLRQIGYKL
jgi:adenosine/AMP kinase